jgi:hypothetical protein
MHTQERSSAGFMACTRYHRKCLEQTIHQNKSLEMSDPPSMYLSEYYPKLVLLLDLIAGLSPITSHFILLQGPILYTNILVAITCSNDDDDILIFGLKSEVKCFFLD